MDLSMFTHLSNCHGELTALVAGIPVLGLVVVKFHQLKSWVRHRMGWHTKCCEPHEHGHKDKYNA